MIKKDKHLHIKVESNQYIKLQMISNKSGWSVGKIMRYLIDTYSHRIFK